MYGMIRLRLLFRPSRCHGAARAIGSKNWGVRTVVCANLD